MCDVTLSVYPHRAGLKNMPGHGGIRTYDNAGHQEYMDSILHTATYIYNNIQAKYKLLYVLFKSVLSDI